MAAAASRLALAHAESAGDVQAIVIAQAELAHDRRTIRESDMELAAIQQAIDAARGGRSPSEADPDLDAIAGAGVPVMVVSGGHHDGIELICDGLAARLNGRREIVPGAAHAVPRAPGVRAWR